MAWSDYKICDHCGNAKVFYDANIEDERYQATWGEPSNYDPIGLKAICGDCNKTHQVVIAPRVLEPAPDLAELVAALRPLAIIADAFDANELDDEARKFWGQFHQHQTTTPHEEIELYQGRGGKRLLTLADCMTARAALTDGGKDG